MTSTSPRPGDAPSAYPSTVALPQHSLVCARGTRRIAIPSLAIGTWSWGDRQVWGYDESRHRALLDRAFAAQRRCKLFLLDTAEMYGRDGESERIIGELMSIDRQQQQHMAQRRPSTLSLGVAGLSSSTTSSPLPPSSSSPTTAATDKDATKATLAASDHAPWVLASKWNPFPWPIRRNFMPRGIVDFCRDSCRRMGVETMDLYQVHGPVHLRSIEAVAMGLAACVEQGLTRAVGVSNYSREEMVRMADALDKHGLKLASNQVEFSLLRTLPAHSGLLEECRKRDIVLFAYCPIAMGRLSGKYSRAKPPPGQRFFAQADWEKIESLLSVQRSLAEKYAVTPSAVALRWIVQMGAVPIVGARDEVQVAQNAMAVDVNWRLTDDEMRELAARSQKGGESWLANWWQHG